MRRSLSSVVRAAVGATLCACFTALLLSLTSVSNVPAIIPVLLIGFAGASIWRPDAGLCILAFAVPVAHWTGRTWNGSAAWPEILVLAFAAGYSARMLRGDRRPHPPDSLQTPIWIFAALVIFSLAERVLVLYWSTGGAALTEHLRVAAAEYFVAPGAFPELDAAMRLVEGLFLLRAASAIAHAHEEFPTRLVRLFVAGAAAAALLNLWRIWQGALRFEDPVPVFFDYLTRLRYNVHYPDVNAAGSYFVMALLAGTGVLLSTKQAGWIVALGLIASSVVLSGSRAALLAGICSGLLWVIAQWKLRRTSKPGRWRPRKIWLVLLAASVVLTVVYVGTKRNLTPTSTALQIRMEFARTTLRMVEAHPAFGVGVGRYPAQSDRFSSPVLLEQYGLARENAHNNFLQILGELGMLGFVAFLWVLWATAQRAHRLLSVQTNPEAFGVVAGVLAFVLTWLSGHPLLIDEPAMLFWLLLGTMAGWSPEISPKAAQNKARPLISENTRRIATFLALLTLALSLPLRARQQLSEADLEHQGIGLSNWYVSDDGVRYRLAGSSATVFVPSSARAVRIPLRATPPRSELAVSVYLNGRLANLVNVPGDRWHQLELRLPADPSAPRFSRVDLHIASPPPSAKDVMMIGRVEPR